MNDTIAVVTGGGRGIGLALAHALSAAGHRVLVTDIDEEAANAAAAQIGASAWAVQHDVRDPDSHRRVAEDAMRVGTLRVWVNNAGILIAGSCWSHSDRDVGDILEVNLKGAIAGSRAAVDAMGRHGGGILNVASISALSPVPGLALYAATKAALLSFTTSLQGDLDHAGLPIRARALCPDVVGTHMVTSKANDLGAAMLFSGPKPLKAEAVAKAGLALLEGRQVFRVVPRWRGLVARSSELVPAAGLKVLAAMRRLGERRQRTSQPKS